MYNLKCAEFAGADTLKVLKIEAVCSIGIVAAKADCQTGNELKNYY